MGAERAIGRRAGSLLIVVSLLVAACSGDESDVSTDDAPEPTMVMSGGVLRLSEINYHDPRSDEAAEFVEVVNIGDGPMQLQGWCIDGTGLCFDTLVTLAAGEHLVITEPDLPGTLANDSDTITLVDPLSQPIDSVTYDDRPPWFESADGGGMSLQRRDFSADGNDPTSWTAAPPTPGAPLDPEASADLALDVIISEIHYHPADENPAAVFVELTNTSSTPIDVNGWCLEGAGHCLQDSTVIAPGAASVVAGVFDDGALSRSGDRVRLVAPDGEVHDSVRYRDADEWPAIADGHGASLHRRSTTASGMAPGNWEALPPSPGTPSGVPDASLLPTFTEVEFSRSPSATEAIQISAVVTDGIEPRVAYVVDFGPETLLAATTDDGGRVAATIPPQAPGSLVRFRLVATSATDPATQGSWPRAGDGALYAGTVVTDPTAAESTLPRLQWFMPDDLYRQAYGNVTLHGNDGYPAVLAFDGEVFDNVTLRVKGNQARTNRKRKWKVMLPAGHEWNAGGLLTAPVDQFDLMPAATDASFSREVLVADLQELSGGVAQQVVPLRVERNNEFYGLYLYGESPDAGWRDRQGWSDSTFVWKVDKVSKLRRGELSVERSEFAKKYERITQTYLDDDDELLRGLITALDELEGAELIRFAYEHLDIPQIVEALATMRIVQHSEWQHKNYYIMFDPVDARWRLVPIDFDLTFGRRFASGCGALCDEISASPYLEYPGENRLAAVLLDNEPFRSMVDRRTRTLADEYLAEGRLETRLAELLAALEPDSRLDRGLWPFAGGNQSMAAAQQRIIDEFLIPKRGFYLGTDRYLPLAQPADPTISVESVSTDAEGKVLSARIVNGESIAIDLSLREFTDIAARLPAGVVLPPGAGLTIVFERAPVQAGGVLELTVVAQRIEAD